MDTIALRELYLELLKNTLTHSFGDTYQPIRTRAGVLRHYIVSPIQTLLSRFQLELVRRRPFDARAREEGKDWPVDAETMVGLRRLTNVQICISNVIREKVPGDFIETGVWKGGTTIFMRAMLKVYGERSRKVWVADSFQGVPKPNAKKYPADKRDSHWRHSKLAISLDTVRGNFKRYGLLDDQVRFLPGWFHETLPTADIEKLAILRLDADMYESTIIPLEILYPKLSPAGYVIIDDYGAVHACKKAVDDYREKNAIREPMHPIDWSGYYWKKA